MCDFASKILDAQADTQMKGLAVDGFTNIDDKQDLKEEDRSLINSIVRSGLTQLVVLSLSDNKTWWGDEEATEHFCEFIKD